uniref:Carcinoembryonic antigen-related cell adhesion molecule 19 isoform X2 n=1 Tax=Phascolarctos cinereus TaxID=38626 RepID=A0A6P5LRM9_PHACI|nr:carcinoembryonic antigen-related cell adhesion molecule 19 isoform X2 [Phascolarctos cinereus]
MSQPHGGGCVWKEFVFTASLLAWWTAHQAWAALLIEKIPEVPQEGQDILLSVHGVPGAIQDFNWYQGEETDGGTMIFSYIPGLQRPQRDGNAMKGRNIIGFPNGSLLLRQAKPKDSGTYQVGITINPAWIMRVKTELRVTEKGVNTTSPIPKHQDPVDSSSPMNSGITVAIVIGCLGLGVLVVGSGLVYLLVTRSWKIKSPGATTAKPDLGRHMCHKHKADSSNIYEVIHSPSILITPANDKGSGSPNLTTSVVRVSLPSFPTHVPRLTLLCRDLSNFPSTFPDETSAHKSQPREEGGAELIMLILQMETGSHLLICWAQAKGEIRTPQPEAHSLPIKGLSSFLGKLGRG